MKGRVLSDANLLVCAALQPDPRSGRARDPPARGGVAGVQAVGEFANVARRELGRPWPEVKRALADIRALCPSPLPPALATQEAALGITGGFGYGFHDSLVIASALGARCAALFPEGMQGGQVVEGALTIWNPFAP